MWQPVANHPRHTSSRRRASLRAGRLFRWLWMGAALATGGACWAGDNSGVLLDRRFENFVAGRFGNAGQNLYVSRAGALQRVNPPTFGRPGASPDGNPRKTRDSFANVSRMDGRM